MFGYVICNKESLEKGELERYQGMYCGVCKSLERQFGQLERLGLNFDMTFLALFLSALYEPEEKEGTFRCTFHPRRKKPLVENEFTDYAACMTVALVYHKCVDDWEDEKKKSSRLYGKLLKEKYEDIRKRYPRQCQCIESSLEELRKIENTPGVAPDEAVNCSGRMLSEVFVYKEDFWSNSLRIFGYELGRFIYLMDAAMDYHKDLKTNNYNPLFAMHKKPEEMEGILTMAIGRATEQFEQLPIVQDANLIRNVLYGGVWQKYYAKIKGNTQRVYRDAKGQADRGNTQGVYHNAKKQANRGKEKSDGFRSV